MKKNSSAGFSLLEVLLVVVLVTGVIAIQGPVLSGYFLSNSFGATGTTVSHLLRQAQAYAVAGIHDDGWGVHVTESDAVLFKGDAYATRDVAYDTVYEFPLLVEHAGDTECVFTKHAGKTTSGCSLSFVHGSGRSMAIYVTEYGGVSLQ
jgi:type II secretory pathway pseudopilin PulG